MGDWSVAPIKSSVEQWRNKTILLFKKKNGKLISYCFGFPFDLFKNLLHNFSPHFSSLFL